MSQVVTLTARMSLKQPADAIVRAALIDLADAVRQEPGCLEYRPPMGAKGGDSNLYDYCVDDPVNRLDAWGLADDWWDGARKIGAGLEQLWDKAPDGITQAVSKGAQGAQEAVRKAAEAYVTNDDLQKYTGMGKLSTKAMYLGILYQAMLPRQ